MARLDRSEWLANRHLAMGARQPAPTRPRPVQARPRLTLGAALYHYGPALLAAIAVLEVAALLA